MLNKSFIHWTSVHLSSALTGAAITVLALAEPFIAAGAAVGLFAFVYCFLKALMVSSYRLGLVLFSYRKRTRPPRLWAEWNYECLVGTTKHSESYYCRIWFFLNRYAGVILNRVKKLCCMNDSLFGPLIAAGVASVFCLETKGTNAEAPLRWDHEDL